jgi:hypothetical protein
VVTESRFEQERRWLIEMEQLGPEAVRMLHRHGKPVTSQPLIRNPISLRRGLAGMIVAASGFALVCFS